MPKQEPDLDTLLRESYELIHAHDHYRREWFEDELAKRGVLRVRYKTHAYGFFPSIRYTEEIP